MLEKLLYYLSWYWDANDIPIDFNSHALVKTSQIPARHGTHNPR